MIDKTKQEYYQTNDYSSHDPIYVKKDQLTDQQRSRLTQSKVFCMIPWIHIHAFPTGMAYPCCLSDSEYPIGDLHTSTIREVWNSDAYKQIRYNMLNELPSHECSKCYEREKFGFISMRNDTNKNFGHHIGLADQTRDDGHLDEFKIRYYDIRFTNLCNFSCRTCGSWFSSSWYQEETELFGKRNHPQFMYAGKDANDMWNQMLEHIPYLEQIYFAGGEPLIMEEHYRILKELSNRQMFKVRLIYNTNFSRLNLKDEDVLDYWQRFEDVSIGASLDAMGPRAEYIRKGTRWDDIIRNRERMIEKCPDTDFYVSSTVSIYNVLHIMDFHRDWVDRGLIKPQDWNINILQGPERARIDVLPEYYKSMVREKIQQHLEWLRPLDPLTRAVGGYESILNFMDSGDRSHLLNDFFTVNEKMDNYRKEGFDLTFPELKDLRNYV